MLDDYQGVALELGDWSALDGRVEVQVFREHLADEDALVEALQRFEIVVAMRERTPFPRAVLERLPKLELLVTTGNRNAAIDVAACADHGVTLCGTGGSVESTAELTWALILACARHLPEEVANVRGGGWMSTVGADLGGRTLGLCGLGRIGALVARVGTAFGMELIAWSQNLTPERCAELGATLVDKEELFRRADVLSVHLVLSERTTGLVGERELRLMKPTAILVNTSRGPICDEEVLARACAERWIAAAGLDAFGTEPLPAGHAFRTLGNVIATPHIGYVSEAVYRTFFHDIVEDIVAFLDGAPVRVVAP
ncbi:MAG: D-2-hydroxyacid dehydrogenase family protein [Acidimicrobiia bacterium]|nr:D-2-hydroxyacid dehydrogenase family protein [Acidimicrobiia bacterium]